MSPLLCHVRRRLVFSGELHCSFTHAAMRFQAYLCSAGYQDCEVLPMELRSAPSVIWLGREWIVCSLGKLAEGTASLFQVGNLAPLKELSSVASSK